MSTNIQQLIARLETYESLQLNDAWWREQTLWLRSAASDELDELLQALLDRPAPSTRAEDRVLAAVLEHLVWRQREAGAAAGRTALTEPRLHRLVALYRHLGTRSEARWHLLNLLTVVRLPFELREFAELVADDPPEDRRQLALAFGPLFQHLDYDVNALFPRLLDGLANLSVAAVILDLANYLKRSGTTTTHPASSRAAVLANLLGGITQRLAQVEEQNADAGKSPMGIERRVAESVDLTVSLCDALALIGDSGVVGKLYQTLELGHRRLRAEAASALARLGEEAGRKALVELSAEPSVRLRVLAYCEELGILDQIEPQYRTAVARAEAELVCWLAQPENLGLPPTECELFDSRTQYWPGYDEPVECFLFRYSYRTECKQYSNIGIAGPLTCALTANLADLPPDDLYAVFAGWQAEHEEIYEFDVELLNAAQQPEIARLERRMRDSGFERVQPIKLGMFFGTRVLVAKALREGMPGTVVADAADVAWHAQRQAQDVGPDEAYFIYKGRRLLRSFNPD